MIKSEIEQCIRTLDQDSVNLLSLDRWTSAVNSGALRLLEPDIELEPLSISYQEIKNYNQLITDQEILIGGAWDGILKGTDSNIPRISISFTLLIARRIKLTKNLRKLSNAEWW